MLGVTFDGLSFGHTQSLRGDSRVRKSCLNVLWFLGINDVCDACFLSLGTLEFTEFHLNRKRRIKKNLRKKRLKKKRN